MDPTQLLSLTPISTLSYCVYSVTLSSGSLGSVINWTDYSGNNVNSQVLSVFTNTYTPSSIGTVNLTFTYSWSKSNTSVV